MLEPEYKQFCLTAIQRLREPARLGQLLDDVTENVIVREETPSLKALTLIEAMTMAEAGDPEYMKVQVTGVLQFTVVFLHSSCLSEPCLGKTATNHNRCLHLTANDFFERFRAAKAKTEDFDDVVAEFGRGCPCKEPPLKSTGKQHLKSATHDKAFNQAGGFFFGLSLRAAFELQRPVAEVVHVPCSQRIGNDAAAESQEAFHYDDSRDMEFMDEDIPDDADVEVASREVSIDEDEDMSDKIVVGDE
jgi:hypothetical protein